MAQWFTKPLRAELIKQAEDQQRVLEAKLKTGWKPGAGWGDGTLIKASVGEPNIPVSRAVRHRWYELLDQLPNWGYGPMGGDAHTKEVLAQHFNHAFGTQFTPQSVSVTQSGSQALSLIMTALTAHDAQGILVDDPSWAVYYQMIDNVRGQPVPVPYRTIGDAINVDGIRDALQGKLTGEPIKVMLITNPSNPTSEVFSADQVRTLVEITEDLNTFLIYDAAYMGLRFSNVGEIVHPTTLAPQRSALTYTFSKAGLVAGARIGGLGFAPELAYGEERALQHVLNADRGANGSPNPITQRLLWALLEKDAAPAVGVREEFERRYRIFSQGLDALGIAHADARAAFYTFVHVNENSVTASAQLLEECGISTVPGAGFGHAGERSLRFSLGSLHQGQISEVLTRLEYLSNKNPDLLQARF